MDMEESNKAENRTQQLFPPEHILQSNARMHQHTIIQYLTPSHPTFHGLLSDLNLADDFIHRRDRLHNKAKILLEKVRKENIYTEFLKCLEKDSQNNEHLGHTHIASLLRGKKCSRDTEKYEESENIYKKINQECSSVISQLNISALLPYLCSHKLVTENDFQELSLNNKTNEDKVKLFLTLLTAKGPTAHYIFFHECLAKEKQHSGHQSLYDNILQLLNTSKSSRKRQASAIIERTSEPSEKVPRCSHFMQLDLPQGIVATDYILKITELRQLSDPDYAKLRLRVEIDYKKNSSESRIAYCLEMCFYFANDLKQTKQFVSEAKTMLKQFEGSICNPEILEARCHLVLGRSMSICQKHTQATKELNSAFGILCTFENGEDCILAHYFKACSLMKAKSPRKWKMIIIHLQRAIDISEQENYGMDINQFCKIRLAQAYLRLSADNPISETSLDNDDIKRAQDLLNDVEVKNKDMKPAAKCFYLMTCSDAARLADDILRATAYAKQGLLISKTQYHTSLIERRLNLLKLYM